MRVSYPMLVIAQQNIFKSFFTKLFLINILLEDTITVKLNKSVIYLLYIALIIVPIFVNFPETWILMLYLNLSIFYKKL